MKSKKTGTKNTPITNHKLDEIVNSNKVNQSKNKPVKSSFSKDISADPVYHFLETLSENSTKHFKKGNSRISVVEYLSIKYEPSLDRREPIDILEMFDLNYDIIYLKKKAIKDLKSAMKTDPRNKEIVKIEDIHSIMTENRYEYFKELAKEFNNNQSKKLGYECDDMITFIMSLPRDEYDNALIKLPCDSKKEFKELYALSNIANPNELKPFFEEIFPSKWINWFKK